MQMSLMSLAWGGVSLPGQPLSLCFDRKEWAFPEGDRRSDPSPSPGCPLHLPPPLDVSRLLGLLSNLILQWKLQECQAFLSIPLPSDYPFKQRWLQEIAVVQGGCHNTQWLKPACVIHGLIEVITRGKSRWKAAECANPGCLSAWVSGFGVKESELVRARLVFSVMLFHSESKKLSRVWVSEHAFPQEDKSLLFVEGPPSTDTIEKWLSTSGERILECDSIHG